MAYDPLSRVTRRKQTSLLVYSLTLAAISVFDISIDFGALPVNTPVKIPEELAKYVILAITSYMFVTYFIHLIEDDRSNRGQSPFTYSIQKDKEKIDNISNLLTKISVNKQNEIGFLLNEISVFIPIISDINSSFVRHFFNDMRNKSGHAEEIKNWQKVFRNELNSLEQFLAEAKDQIQMEHDIKKYSKFSRYSFNFTNYIFPLIISVLALCLALGWIVIPIN